MNDVLHVSIRDNGIYTSIPWLVRALVAFTSGYWSDWLVSTGRVSITNARKLFVVVCKNANKSEGGVICASNIDVKTK